MLLWTAGSHPSIQVVHSLPVWISGISHLTSTYQAPILGLLGHSLLSGLTISPHTHPAPSLLVIFLVQ